MGLPWTHILPAPGPAQQTADLWDAPGQVPTCRIRGILEAERGQAVHFEWLDLGVGKQFWLDVPIWQDTHRFSFSQLSVSSPLKIRHPSRGLHLEPFCVHGTGLAPKRRSGSVCCLKE